MRNGLMHGPALPPESSKHAMRNGLMHGPALPSHAAPWSHIVLVQLLSPSKRPQYCPRFISYMTLHAARCGRLRYRQAALRRAAESAVTLHGHHRGSVQPPAQEQEAGQGWSFQVAGQETSRARRCHEFCGSPAWRRQGQVKGAHFSVAVGAPCQGWQNEEAPQQDRCFHCAQPAQGQEVSCAPSMELW